MLKLQEIASIRNLILSDRITYKGSEIGAVNQILMALSREEASARVKPQVTPPEAPPTPAGTEGTE